MDYHGHGLGINNRGTKTGGVDYTWIGIMMDYARIMFVGCVILMSVSMAAKMDTGMYCQRHLVSV